MKTLDISSLEKLRAFSAYIYKKEPRVFLLSGDLGAGKTTFVAQFIKENLVSKGENFEDLGVMSPTFSLINQYQTQKHLVVHADMYRLKENDFEEEELLHLIDDADYSFIEWPSKLNLTDTLSESFDVITLNFKIKGSLRTVDIKQL